MFTPQERINLLRNAMQATAHAELHTHRACQAVMRANEKLQQAQEQEYIAMQSYDCSQPRRIELAQALQAVTKAEDKLERAKHNHDTATLELSQAQESEHRAERSILRRLQRAEQMPADSEQDDFDSEPESPDQRATLLAEALSPDTDTIS